MREPSGPPPIDRPDCFRDLMRRFREGSEEAAEEILREYEGRMLRARDALDGRLRSKFDPDDIVQSAWESFVRRRDNADRFENPERLGAFLVGTVRDLAHRQSQRWLATEQHDVGRETPFADLPPARKTRTRLWAGYGPRGGGHSPRAA